MKKQTRHKENILHHEDSQALQQAGEKGCAVSVLGIFQGNAQQIPEQSYLNSLLILC